MDSPVLTAFGNAGQGMLSSASNSFGSSLGSGLGDLIFGGVRAQRQWKYQQKAMSLQQQYALEQMAKAAEFQLAHDKEMFDYQNAYNDPSKVFERFRKAGITPAAALGASGVGVSATVPTGSGAAPSASGPTGGSAGVGSAMPGFNGDPTAIAQIEMAKSGTDRNRAAAELDRAQAQDIKNKMQPAEYYSTMAELNRQITQAGVTNAQAVADMNTALATLYKADAEYADLAATYKFQDLVAMYSKHVEEYEQIRKYNIQYMDQLYTAQICLDYARAYQSFNSGDLAASQVDINQVHLADLQNWFQLNWETKIKVPQVTESGKPTGKYVEMTGKDIHAYLMGLSLAHGNQATASNWFSTRSEKNAFGYQLANTALHGAIQVAGAYAGGRAYGSALSTTGSEATRIEKYDARGNYVGGTLINKDMISNRSRGR